MTETFQHMPDATLKPPCWKTVILAGMIGYRQFSAPAGAWAAATPEATAGIRALAEAKIGIITFGEDGMGGQLVRP